MKKRMIAVILIFLTGIFILAFISNRFSLEKKLDKYYCYIPQYGIQTKYSDTAYFYALKLPFTVVNDDYVVSVLEAYYEEETERLNISLDLSVLKENSKDFFEKYNNAETRPKISVFSGNKELDFLYGSQGMDSNNGNNFSFSGWFNCPKGYQKQILRLCGEFGIVEFCLDEIRGFSDLKECGKTVDEGNGIYTVIFEEKYDDKVGLVITVYSDKSIFSDIIDININKVELIGENININLKKINSKSTFIYSDQTDLIASNCNIDYSYDAHLSYNNKNDGSISVKIDDVNKLNPIKINLFEDNYIIIEKISIDNLNNTTCLISSSENLKGISSVGRKIYIDDGKEEVQLIEIEKDLFTGKISENAEKLNIRIVVPNIYMTKSNSAVLN